MREPAAKPGANWLDDLTLRGAGADARAAAGWDAALCWTARLLLASFLLLILVGLDPLQRGDGESAGGDRARQLAFLALFAASLPLIILRWRAMLLLTWRTTPLLLVFAALAATTAWSAYPMVTVRRLMVMTIVLVVAMAVASVLRTPREFLAPVLVTFAIVLLANYALTVAMPGFAQTDIGLAGLHASKNVAGMVAQTMAILFAGALIAVRHRPTFWLLVALLGLSLVFLTLTQSKTAMGLTALGLLAIMPAALLAARTRLGIVALGSLLVLGVGTAVFLTGALDLSAADWAVLTTGDATFTQRDDLWRAAVAHIRAQPLLGYGFGAQWSMLPLYHPLTDHWGFWTGSYETLKVLNQSHNGYLDLMIHGGVLLVGIAGVFIVVTLARVTPRPGTAHDRWTLAGSAIVATFFITLLLSNGLESTLFFPDGLLGQLMIILVVGHAGWSNDNPRSFRPSIRAQASAKPSAQQGVLRR